MIYWMSYWDEGLEKFRVAKLARGGRVMDDWAAREIARLRQQLKDYRIAHESVARDNERLDQERTAIIEECARVADGFGDKYYFMSAVDIAAAIRALKDKTP